MNKCVMVHGKMQHGFTASDAGDLFPDNLRCHCGKWTWGELDEQDDEKLLNACKDFARDPFKNVLSGIYVKGSPKTKQKEDDKTYGLYDSLAIRKE